MDDLTNLILINIEDNDICVQSVSFNGKQITNWKLMHEDIMNGGELVFTMTNKPQN